MPKEKYYHIASIEKGMRVLELLSDHEEMSVSDVGNRLGYNRAAAHRFLATLRDLGYVEKSESNRYRMTFKVLEMGMKVANRSEIRTRAHPYLQELSAAFNETVNLGMWNGKEVLHIDKIDSREILRIDSHLGATAPAYCTALGKSILAHLSDEAFHAYLHKLRFRAYGPNTITSRKTLKRELKIIRESGVAHDNEELARGLKCVAAPVFNHTRHPKYAISVSGPAMRMTGTVVHTVSERVIDVCRRLSVRLGHTAPLSEPANEKQ